MPKSKLKELIDKINNEPVIKGKKAEKIIIPKEIKEPKTTKASTAKNSTSKSTKKDAKKTSNQQSIIPLVNEVSKKTDKKVKSTKPLAKKVIAKTSKATTKKIKSTKSVLQSLADEANKKSEFVNISEYYDLPYKYNQTVVKVLAQNPNTLFIYWDVSDSDIENFKKAYGENFFYITKPVLIIHNITDNYTFEVDINDFANNWYVHVNDTKCKYVVELGRRPNQSDTIRNAVNEKVTDFINISYSNTIEMPNDHVLFFKANDKIYFKNIKTNKITETIFNDNTHIDNVKAIYKNYELSEAEDRFDFRNPSSQNPTSNVM